ncbi:unnamed protein product, partial [Brassica oleracea]
KERERERHHRESLICFVESQARRRSFDFRSESVRER